MIDKYLCASSEQAAIQALSGLGMYSNGAWVVISQRWALDPIGSIENKTGFFLNLRLLDEALATSVDATGLVIQPPQTPVRVWSGGMVD